MRVAARAGRRRWGEGGTGEEGAAGKGERRGGDRKEQSLVYCLV